MKRQYTFLTGLVLALLVFSGAGARARAQDATPAATPEGTVAATPEATAGAITPLSYGQPVSGSIDDTNFQQNWPLSTASADRIQVTVKRTGGNLVPGINILDNTGTNLAQSYGADKTYAGAQVEDFTLPAAGDYVIQVTRDGDQNGKSTGAYSLVVTPLGTGPENPNNTTVISEIKTDTPVDGEITATHWLHLYSFTAQAGDELDIIAKRTGGTLAPVVQVLDSNGNSLQTGYNSNDFADTGNFQLPAPGQYTIEVSRYSDQKGDTLGTYELTVQMVGSGDGSPLLQVAAGKAAYDQELDGKITPDQWYQDWQLTTEAGDTLTITVNRKDGDLIPEVILMGGSGQNLNQGYEDNTYASAQIASFKLDGAGTYTVRVTRKSGQTGSSSGAYSLMIALNGAGKTSPKLTQPVGNLTLGQASQGEITNAQWENVWTFSADKGSQIDVNVARTDGTLAPTLEILDANGQQLTSAYSSDAHDTSQITSYTFPSPGKYQIVVGRESDQDGQTAGKYSVTVSTTSASS